jgi:hypothetical protein
MASQSATYVTSDVNYFGTGDEDISVEWTEPVTGTVFGFRAEWPASILAVRTGFFTWGYYVSPAPAGHSTDWVMKSSYFVDEDVTTPITVHGFAPVPPDIASHLS